MENKGLYPEKYNAQGSGTTSRSLGGRVLRVKSIYSCVAAMLMTFVGVGVFRPHVMAAGQDSLPTPKSTGSHTAAAGQKASLAQDYDKLPVAAQPVVSATLGHDDTRYQVGAVGSGLRTQNPAQALQADFTQQGMEVRWGQTHWRLALSGYGYGDRLEKVGEATPQSQANRVEYRRGPLVEWYVNGPAGLEQGFTISAPPGSGASGTRDTGHGTRDYSPLTIALEIGGDLTATADSSPEGQRGARAQGLTLRDGQGQAVLRYSGLTAHDATGRALVTWLEVGKEELRLRVEDSGARYPVVVDPFVQQALLTASDGVSGDELGISVSMSSDGSTIVAGAALANSAQGAAYVFVMPGDGWDTTPTFTAKLTNSAGGADALFGGSVGVSSNGSTIVVGGGSNAAYVFVNPGSWTTTSTPTAVLSSSGAVWSDFLGSSVAISSDGSTIVAGAYHTKNQPGAAYVFAKPEGGWATTSTPAAELTNSAGAGDDELGFSVSISGNGNTVVAGALGVNSWTGAAYVFVNPGTWTTTSTPTAVLTNSAGVAGDELGTSVSISSDGSTIVAGAPQSQLTGPGAAYVFANPGTWATTSTPTAVLTNSGGAIGDDLGFTVGISSNGNTVAVGAPFANSGPGAVDVFVMPAGGWASTSNPNTEVAVPSTSDIDSNINSASVGISGDGMAIAEGAPAFTANGNLAQGAVSVNLTAPTVTFTCASGPCPSTLPYQDTFTVTSSWNGVVGGGSVSLYTPNYDVCFNIGGTTYEMWSGTGLCTVDASWGGTVDYASAQMALNINASEIAPAVSFTGAPTSAPYQGTFTVASTTNSSSLPVYTSSGSCSNLGTLYTVTSTSGVCASTVTWAADGNYTGATLSQTTAARNFGQTISFTQTAPENANYESKFPVAASSTSGLKVALSVDAGSKGVCSLGPRTTVSGVTSATVTMLKGSGTCTLDANQAGNANYTMAAQEQTSATAQEIGQTISLTQTAPPSANYQSTFPVAASSTSGLTVSLSVDAGSKAVCSLGTRTIMSGVTSAMVTMVNGTGTCTLDANQAGNNDYTAAPEQQTSAAAQQIGQTITFTQTAPPSANYKSTFPVAASSTSGLKVSLSVDAGSEGNCSLGALKTASGVSSATVTMRNSSGTCTIDANQAGNDDYTAAAQEQTSAAASP